MMAKMVIDMDQDRSSEEIDFLKGFSQRVLATSVQRTAESVLHQKFKVDVNKIAISAICS